MTDNTSLPQADSVQPTRLALCEANRLVLRIGRPYVFRPVAGCAECDKMAADARSAYGPDEEAAEPIRAGEAEEDWWIALAERHASADWNSDKPDGYLNAVKALVNDALSRQAPAAPAGAMTRTIEERDNYHEWADKLADAIAQHFGVDIGEHSSANNPWAMALDAIQAAPKQTVKAMVDRFLMWRLPDTFSPDCFIKFDRERMQRQCPTCWPIGTNLLTSEQAREMFEYVLAAPIPAEPAKMEAPARIVDHIPADAATLLKELKNIAHDEDQPLGNRLQMISARISNFWDALSTPPTPEAEPVQQDTKGEYCWLVELRSVVLTGGPYYHTGFTDLHGQSRSTKDPLKAKRYPTKEAAQLAAFKLDHIAGTWEAIEHGFMSTAPQAPSGQQAEPTEAQYEQAFETHKNQVSPYTTSFPIFRAGMKAGFALAGQQSERPAPAGLGVGLSEERIAQLVRNYTDCAGSNFRKACDLVSAAVDEVLASSQAERQAVKEGGNV